MNSAGPAVVEQTEHTEALVGADAQHAETPANRLPNLLAVIRRHQQTLQFDATKFDAQNVAARNN